MKWELKTYDTNSLPVLTGEDGYGRVSIDKDGLIKVEATDYDAESTEIPVDDMRNLIAAFDAWKARQ